MPLNRRQFLAGAAATSAAFAAKKRTEQPNIVLIVTDGLASWMLGCYGNQEIQTPHIDTLARAGMRFANNFCYSPVASSSRATLLTGSRPELSADHWAKDGMISDVLAKQGYNCGYVGSWELSGAHISEHGFQYTYDVAAGQAQNPELKINGAPSQEKGFTVELLTTKACSFLDQQKGGKPFFLTVSYRQPHPPYDGHPPKYTEMYAKSTFEALGWERSASNAARGKDLLSDAVGNIRKTAAATTALDAQLPAIMKKLQEMGLRDNTLVIFASLTGSLLGRHGLWSDGTASSPPNMYEEVVRVPMIWNWPGKIPPEFAAPDLVSLYDFMPTLCDVAGASELPNRNLMGRSYAPILRREAFPKKMPWKQVVFGKLENTQMIREKRYKLVFRDSGNGSNELFDLTVDPYEKVNQYENAQLITIRDRLKAQLAASGT